MRIPDSATLSRSLTALSGVVTTAVLPLTAHAAQPSLLYEAYSTGMTSLIPVGLGALAAARSVGGLALGHVLSQRLKDKGFDAELFDKTRPGTFYALPLVAGTVVATAFVSNFYVGGHNFEMATLTGLAGAAVLAGEALCFSARTALAYRASQRKLTTETERNEAIADYAFPVQNRLQILGERLSVLRTQISQEGLIEQIRNKNRLQTELEGIEAEMDYLKIRFEGLQTERYARVFASYRGDLRRYFEELPAQQSRQDIGSTSTKRKIQKTAEGIS